MSLLTKSLASLIVLASAFGCSAKEYRLDPKWRPIRKIVERSSLPLVANNVCFVLKDKIYVRDLDWWLKEYPPSKMEFHLILRHEYVHAVRQRDYVEKNHFWRKLGMSGPAGWIRKYFSHKEFRLNEEKLAYYAYVKGYLDHRRKIPKEFIVRIMSSGYFGMIDHHEATQWVEEVVSGRWRPSPGELPQLPR